MRYAAAAEADASCYTVAEHNFDLFDLYKRQDLEACILSGLARVDDMPKGETELRERCLGYNLDKASLWLCPIARANFHIDMMQHDILHCYFANGIVCIEIILLLKEAREHMGATVEQLCEAMLQADWQRHDAGESRYWLKRLWTQNLFRDSVYKGFRRTRQWRSYRCCDGSLRPSVWRCLPWRTPAVAFSSSATATFCESTKRSPQRGEHWMESNGNMRKCLLHSTQIMCGRNITADCTWCLNMRSMASQPPAGELKVLISTTSLSSQRRRSSVCAPTKEEQS